MSVHKAVLQLSLFLLSYNITEFLPTTLSGSWWYHRLVWFFHNWLLLAGKLFLASHYRDFKVPSQNNSNCTSNFNTITQSLSQSHIFSKISNFNIPDKCSTKQLWFFYIWSRNWSLSGRNQDYYNYSVYQLILLSNQTPEFNSQNCFQFGGILLPPLLPAGNLKVLSTINMFQHLTFNVATCFDFKKTCFNI